MREPEGKWKMLNRSLYFEEGAVRTTRRHSGNHAPRPKFRNKIIDDIESNEASQQPQPPRNHSGKNRPTNARPSYKWVWKKIHLISKKKKYANYRDEKKIWWIFLILVEIVKSQQPPKLHRRAVGAAVSAPATIINRVSRQNRRRADQSLPHPRRRFRRIRCQK